MTPDELVTRNDLAKMQESILKAMEAMLHPQEEYLSFEQAVVYLKTKKRPLALGNGADLFTVSKLLGHTKITTTQIYAKVLDEGRKKAVDAIPDL